MGVTSCITNTNRTMSCEVSPILSSRRSGEHDAEICNDRHMIAHWPPLATADATRPPLPEATRRLSRMPRRLLIESGDRRGFSGYDLKPERFGELTMIAAYQIDF